MILNRLRFLFFFVIFSMTMFGTGCVDIPSNAPDPPRLEAQYRFMSLSPSGVITPTAISIADGPSFASYQNYTIGGNATPSNYITFNSGSKRIIYNNGVQNDTMTVTFETDQRATLVFARNQKPDSLKAGLVDPIKLPYRYTFAPNGLTDSTVVRFTNLVQGYYEDTLDIYQSDSTLDVGIIKVDNLRYGQTSGAQSGTSTVKIPRGKSYTFFFTNNNNNTERVFKDSVVIAGASNKVFSIFVYDKYDTTATSALRNANVKVKVLEEL